MTDAAVLIVGAGPTGLVLGVALAQRGIPLRIIERNHGPGQASRAMVVQARTLELYQHFGFADEVVAQGIKVPALHLRQAGREVAGIVLGEVGAGLSPFPFALSYPQDDHERFLVAKLQAMGVQIEWDTQLVDFRQDQEGVYATIVTPQEHQVYRFAYICGCDGGHSRVREVLGLPFPGGTYEQLFFVADVQITGQRTTDLIVNFGASDLALMLPVRSSGMQRLIGTVPMALRGRQDPVFDDIRAGVEQQLGITVEQVNWFSTYKVHHRVVEHFRVERAFLVGDAAHLHSPAGGQGMNTGIGDAVNLGWKLADVIAARADPAILDTYETERIAFARTLVATTDTAFRGMVEQGTGARWLRVWLLPALLHWLTSLKMVRHLMFKTISQIRISYRSSALSVGRAGGIHAGDRLPWVHVADADNFPARPCLEWRLQVHGTPSMELSTAATARGLGLDAFAWSAQAKQAGLRRDAAYLVRPDGHIALILVDQKVADLDHYCARFALRFSLGR